MKSVDLITPITIRGDGPGPATVPSNCGSVIRGLAACVLRSLPVGPRRSPTLVQCATNSLTPLTLHLPCLVQLVCQCLKLSMEYNNSALMVLMQARCCLIQRAPSIDTLNISKCMAHDRFITRVGRRRATLFRHCSTSVRTSPVAIHTKPMSGNYSISPTTSLNRLTCQPNIQIEYANLKSCGSNKPQPTMSSHCLIQQLVIQGTLANTHCLIPRHINQALTR